MVRIKIAIFLVLVLNISVFSQRKSRQEKAEEKQLNEVFKLKGLQYGFNFGVYKANNKTANYYNGTGINSLETEIKGKYDYTGTYNSVYNEIKEKVFGGDSFRINSLPYKMKYNIALNMGFYTKYNFTDNLGLFFEINFAKFKSNGTVSLQWINSASGTPSDKDILSYGLLGTESRVDMNLGLCKSFGPPKMFKPYIDAAFNLNNTKVLSADILIDKNIYDKPVNLKYSYLNKYNEHYNIYDYGVGYGVTAGGGLQIVLSEVIILHAGLDLSMKKIHLGDYNGTYLNSTFYIRILFHKLIVTNPEE